MEEIISKFKTLNQEEQHRVLETLNLYKKVNFTNDQNNLLKIREVQFNLKQATCPHCD